MGSQALAHLEALAAQVEGLHQEAERARKAKEEAETAAAAALDDEGGLDMEVDAAAAPAGRRAPNAPDQLPKPTLSSDPELRALAASTDPYQLELILRRAFSLAGVGLVLDGAADGDVLAKRQCVPGGTSAASAALPSPSPEAAATSG